MKIKYFKLYLKKIASFLFIDIDSSAPNYYDPLHYLPVIFLEEGIENIKEYPKKYFKLYLKKIASFLFIDIDSSAPNYYDPLHYLPVIFLGITSLLGIIVSDKKSYQLNYLILIFCFYVFTFSFFAVLPRYKLAIIPLQIIFTNNLIEYINKKFSKT